MAGSIGQSLKTLLLSVDLTGIYIRSHLVVPEDYNLKPTTEVALKAVSINMDCGLRTADCGLRTADCGLGIKYGLGIKHGLGYEQAHTGCKLFV